MSSSWDGTPGGTGHRERCPVPSPAWGALQSREQVCSHGTQMWLHLKGHTLSLSAQKRRPWQRLGTPGDMVQPVSDGACHVEPFQAAPAPAVGRMLRIQEHSSTEGQPGGWQGEAALLERMQGTPGRRMRLKAPSQGDGAGPGPGHAGLVSGSSSPVAGLVGGGCTCKGSRELSTGWATEAAGPPGAGGHLTDLSGGVSRRTLCRSHSCSTSGSRSSWSPTCTGLCRHPAWGSRG